MADLQEAGVASTRAAEALAEAADLAALAEVEAADLAEAALEEAGSC